MPNPNILIIYTDQQRWDTLGANGNPHIQTPNLDQLAADGANFDGCVCQNPLCMPSRASFLTGCYPSQLGITHMAVPLPEDTLTLPRMLKPYGYRTANFGKLHFQPHSNRDHRRPHPDYGFDELVVSDEPGVYEDAYRAWVRRHAPGQLPHLSAGLPPATKVWYETMDITDPVSHPGGDVPRDDFAGAFPFPGEPEFTHSAFVAQKTIDFLQRQTAQTPFLCVAGFFSPHAPWVVPQKFLNLYQPDSLPLPANLGTLTESHVRAATHGYYAAVSEVDFYVGQIMDTLSATGLSENTVIVFTSDHGEWLGDGGRFGKGYPGDDPVTRVPLIVRLPQHRPAEIAPNTLIESVDVLPTLLEAVGIQPPPHLSGRSFFELLRGGPYQPRDSALTEFTGWKTLRTANYRYLLHADGQEQLWHFLSESASPQNVTHSQAHQSALADHRHLLLQRLLQAERPHPRTWPY